MQSLNFSVSISHARFNPREPYILYSVCIVFMFHRHLLHCNDVTPKIVTNIFVING